MQVPRHLHADGLHLNIQCYAKSGHVGLAPLVKVGPRSRLRRSSAGGEEQRGLRNKRKVTQTN